LRVVKTNDSLAASVGLERCTLNTELDYHIALKELLVVLVVQAEELIYRFIF
jgi:hypothetical protein